MYALKIVTNKGVIHSYALGGEYHVEPLDDRKASESAVFNVKGEIKTPSPNMSAPPLCFDIYESMDAYITTMDGKTVHVVNRSGWYLKDANSVESAL